MPDPIRNPIDLCVLACSSPRGHVPVWRHVVVKRGYKRVPPQPCKADGIGSGGNADVDAQQVDLEGQRYARKQ